jgi:hypothetical protein
VTSLALVTGLVAVVIGAVVLTPRPARPPPLAAPVVELPSPAPGRQGPSLVEEQTAPAAAPTIPDRPRCRPLGCERWWTPGTVEPVSPAVLRGDLVVAFEDEVAAVDPVTGTRRWAVPLEDLQPDPATGWRVRAAELGLIGDGDDLLVWVARGFVQLRDPAGAHRWSVTMPDARRLWGAQLAGEVVLVAVAADSPDGPVEAVAAYDRDDGSLRWSQRVRWTYAIGPDGALVRDGDDRVTMLDPASGEAAFHLELEEPRWVSVLGAFFVARASGRETVLLDRETGAVVRTIPDVLAVADLREPEGGLAVLVSGSYEHPDRPQPSRLEAIGGDGRTRWVHSLGCCATLSSSPPGTVAAHLVGDDGPIVLAAADGAVLAPPIELPPDRLRWLSDELLVAAGEDTSLLVDREGARIALTGTRPRVINLDPLIVASREGLLGVDATAAAPAAGVTRPRVGRG